MSDVNADEPAEDRSDTKRAVVIHKTDAEMYLVEYCSLWKPRTTDPAEGLADDSECVGTRIIGVCGPIARRDLLDDDQPLEPSVWLFDRISNWEGDFSAEDAEWMQAEEDAGRVDYPIGVR